MTYFDKLHPWQIIRLLPNMQRLVVARFRRRNDAIAHLQVLSRLTPSRKYTIVFDVIVEQKESIEAQQES